MALKVTSDLLISTSVYQISRLNLLFILGKKSGCHLCSISSGDKIVNPQMYHILLECRNSQSHIS